MNVETPRPRAIRPRDAASLVLIDDRGGEPLILMGRRHARMKFIPDAFVFPGGKLDAGDLLARPATAFSGETARMMQSAAAGAKAEALAMAAIRETFEETGLIVAREGHVGEGAGEGWQPFRERGLAPRLDVLDFVARAITPASSPIRFHARFFLAEGTGLNGELRGNGELLDLDWRPIEACLALPLADITEYVLGEMRDRASGPRTPERIPLFTYRRGRAHVQR